MRPTPRLHPAVFLDRDGTVIEDRGHLADPSEVVFYPDTVDALRRLQERFLLFLVTNQPWVARGILTPEEVDRVNAWVVCASCRAWRSHHGRLRVSARALRRLLLHQAQALFPPPGGRRVRSGPATVLHGGRPSPRRGIRPIRGCTRRVRPDRSREQARGRTRPGRDRHSRHRGSRRLDSPSLVIAPRPLVCHPCEGRGPGKLRRDRALVFAGMTRRRQAAYEVDSEILSTAAPWVLPSLTSSRASLACSSGNS